MQSERGHMKGHGVYEPVDLKCPEQVNSQKPRADWWLPGAERGGGEAGSQCLSW